jgi:hypothetical protein
VYVRAGLGYNKKAEQDVKAALQAADSIPASAVKIVTQEDGVVLSASVKSSDSETSYTLEDPDTEYASCTCHAAVQQRMCKHQLAVLMQLYPGAQHTMLRMLGSKLGHREGVDPHSPKALMALTRQIEKEYAASAKRANGNAVAVPSHAQPPAPLHSVAQLLLESPAPAVSAAMLQSQQAADGAVHPMAQPSLLLTQPQLGATAADPAVQTQVLLASTSGIMPSAAAGQRSAQADAEAQLLERTNRALADQFGQVAQLQEQAMQLPLPQKQALLKDVRLNVGNIARSYNAAKNTADMGSAAQLAQMHVPKGQTSKRHKDCIEAFQSKRKRAPSSEAAEPTAPLLERVMPGTQGLQNAWKGRRGLKDVLQSSVFNDDAAPAVRAAASSKKAPAASSSKLQASAGENAVPVRRTARSHALIDFAKLDSGEDFEEAVSQTAIQHRAGALSALRDCGNRCA